jgi:predicted DCC family thiol-disulfide oxidoreductase YuxK
MKTASKNLNKLQVSNSPLKPLLLYDGNCGFCRKWVGRWRALTRDQVLYEPYQEAAPRFPEIDPQRFTQSLQLILPNGEVLQGAKAVFKSLENIIYLRWLIWSYDHVSCFSGLSEWFYRKVAENRHRVWMNRVCCKKH